MKEGQANMLQFLQGRHGSEHDKGKTNCPYFIRARHIKEAINISIGLYT